MTNHSRSQSVQLIVLVLFSIMLLFFDSRWQAFQRVHAFANRLVMPVREYVAMPGNAMRAVSRYFSTQNALLTNNVALTAALEKANIQVQKVSILRKNNQQLKQLLTLQKSSPLTLLMTKVLDRLGYPYPALYFVRTVSGITVNASVLTGEGVVGQVIATRKRLATVLPIISIKSHVPVQARHALFAGVAQGNGRGQLVIQQVLSVAKLHVGELLETSGLGGVFPAGYLVGTVQSLSPSANPLFLTATLKPAVSFDQLHYVAIAKKQGGAGA